MRSFAATALLFVPLFAACTEEGTGPLEEAREPGAISMSAADIELDDGDTIQVFANVLDQHDNVFSSLPDGVDLAWTTTDPAVVTVSSSGRITALAPGAASVRAETADGLFAVASVLVRPVAASITIVEGNEQDGLPNAPLPDSVTLRVLDRHGNGVAGADVRFRVVSGGGTISPSYGTTDAAGDIRVSWTLGPVIGDQQVQAFTGGAGAPIAIDATISQVIFGGVDVPATASVGGTLPGTIRIDSDLFPTAVGAAHVILSWDPAVLQIDAGSLTSGDYLRGSYRLQPGELHLLSTDPGMTRGDFAVGGFSFDVIGGAGSTTTIQLDIEQLVGTNYLDAAAASIADDIQVTIN